MRTILSTLLVGLTVLFSAGIASAMEAAADPTPLLWDRIRAFDVVVIASTADGFEKATTPVPGTNCVFLPVKVEKVLKGTVKEGAFKISCHQNLPALLAERDKKSDHRYLLVLKLDKDAGVLMAANLYGDLLRFLPADKGMEKVAEAFVKGDTNRGKTVAMCADLLADKDMTLAGVEHVNLLLARTLPDSPTPDFDLKSLGDEKIKKIVESVHAWAKNGAMDTAAAVVMKINARIDKVDKLRVLDESLAEPARRFLADRVDTEADKAKPDWYFNDSVANVAMLLGDMKDKSSKDVLLKMIQSDRWKSVRPKVVAAFRVIFGDEADALLKPILEKVRPEPVILH